MSMYENSGTSTLLSWDIPPWSVCMSRHACLAITLHTWHGHDCCTHVQPSSDRGTFPHWTHLYSIKTRTAAKKYLWSQGCVSDVKSSIFSQLSEVFFWKCAITIMLQCVWETGYTEYRIICKHISSTLKEWMDKTEGENLTVSFYSTHLWLKKSSYSLKKTINISVFSSHLALFLTKVVTLLAGHWEAADEWEKLFKVKLIVLV